MAAFLLVATMLAAAKAPPPDGALASLLDKAGRYSQLCEREFTDLIAEEKYEQKLLDAGHARLRNRRTLRSEVVFVKFEGSLRWMAFRDVFEVDGKPVRDRDARLARLFAGTPDPGAYDRAQEILEASAAYNLGAFSRNFNLPTLALVFLHPDNQARFAFKAKGADTIGKRPVAVVDYEEKASPAFIRDELGHDLFVHGRVWLDGATGRLVRSEVAVKRHLSSDAYDRTASDAAQLGTYQVEITVDFGPWREGGIWVPVAMKELCQTTASTVRPLGRAGSSNITPGGPASESLQTYATYSSYRAIDVATTETFRPAPTASPAP
jgi:hypothetical protein